MSQPFKVCPQCGRAADMHSYLCAHCGRVYRTTAPMNQQTQVFAPKPKPFYRRGASPRLMKGMGIFGVLVIVAAIATSIGDARLPPGPETMALYQKMKPYEVKNSLTFLSAFGGPDRLAHARLQGNDVSFYTYRCTDGEVSVMNDDTVRLVARVWPQGKKRFGSDVP